MYSTWQAKMWGMATCTVDDGLLLRGRLPYVQHCVADLQCIVHFRLRKALRAVLEGKVSLGLLSHLLQKCGAVHRQLLDGFLVLLEHLLTLLHGGGVVQMYHCVGRTLHRIEGLADDVLSGLGQHLDGHILRDHLSLDQCADKIVLRVGGSGEAHLDLLEADLNQQLEELQFILKAHRIDQSLITVSQVNAAPDRCLLNRLFLHPVISHLRRHMIGLSILLFYVHHCHDLSVPTASIRNGNGRYLM